MTGEGVLKALRAELLVDPSTADTLDRLGLVLNERQKVSAYFDRIQMPPEAIGYFMFGLSVGASAWQAEDGAPAIRTLTETVKSVLQITEAFSDNTGRMIALAADGRVPGEDVIEAGREAIRLFAAFNGDIGSKLDHLLKMVKSDA